jgi:hypothetical protein
MTLVSLVSGPSHKSAMLLMTVGNYMYEVVVASKDMKFIQSSVKTDQLLKKFKLYVKALS